MEKSRKNNWTKEEEYTLIEAIQSGGDMVRGSGHSADLNKKKKALWNEMVQKVNSIHGNNRDVKDIKKKWNNLKVGAKSRVDSSRREARRTGGGPNPMGEIMDDDILVLQTDKDISTSATERVTEMLQETPAFSGISGSVDLFQGPSVEESVVEDEQCTNLTILEAPEAIVKDLPSIEGRRTRKRKRSGDISSVHTITAHDLLPLQREVLYQQMRVFSAQLELIEEQREYYKLKKQRLLEKRDQ